MGPRQEKPRGLGGERAGWLGRAPCKAAVLRNFDFTLRAMARLLKTLEVVSDLVGFV